MCLYITFELLYVYGCLLLVLQERVEERVDQVGVGDLLRQLEQGRQEGSDLSLTFLRNLGKRNIKTLTLFLVPSPAFYNIICCAIVLRVIRHVEALKKRQVNKRQA